MKKEQVTIQNDHFLKITLQLKYRCGKVITGDFQKAIETINGPQLTYVVTVQDRLKVNIQGRQVGIYNRELSKDG